MPLSLLLVALQAADAGGGRPIAAAPWVDAARVVLDGDGAEWRGEGPPQVVIDRLEQLVPLAGRPPADMWAGPHDASLHLWVGWSPRDLYLCGEVRDDIADHDGARWYQGDSLELFLNARDREARWGADDFQMMLAPSWPERPWGVYLRAAQGGGTSASDGGFGGVEVAWQPFLGGYRFEARIPWRNFDGLAPVGGERLPFNFALCDRDGRGPLETYATWTGESDVAAFADRRGELLLLPPPPAASAATRERDLAPLRRWLLLLLLCGFCGLALWTRHVWRRPGAIRRGLLVAAGALAVAATASVSARLVGRSETQTRRAELEAYWDRFEELVRSGALGHPEPDRLRELARALLSGQSVQPVPRPRLVHLAPAGVALDPPLLTARRAIPYAPIRPPAPPGADPPLGVELESGDTLVLDLDRARPLEAVHLVVRVSDRRYLRAGSDHRSVLAVEVLRAGARLPGTLEVRHRQDLHHEEDDHADHPGVEPAFYAPGGRLGSVHGDGLLLALEAPGEVDRVELRHVGEEPGYRVTLLAAAAVERLDAPEAPAGMRATATGDWEWAAALPAVRAEVLPPGRGVRARMDGEVARALRIGSEPVGLVVLHDLLPARPAGRWQLLPILVGAALAPFLVAILAEWLALRRRIRGKLAAGFAVSSAVPLLALTVLLDATLRQEHAVVEGERARAALARAEQDLEAEQRELEREARRLLRIAELQKRVEGRYPETPPELEAWWGEGEGRLRVLERTAADGRRRRVGSGPGWETLPRGTLQSSGLARPWGQLLLCGVAHTAAGAEQALTVIVARPPRLPDSGANAATPVRGDAPPVRLIGAGRDPAPSFSQVQPRRETELRRALYGPRGDELMGVLVARPRKREGAVLGDFTLPELLLAAAITAMFTAILFSGILTAHIVAPIERLHRAVRQGRAARLEPGVADEIGDLTSAVRAFTLELEQRVGQLESLRTAQEDLARRLDPDQARQAVLTIFRRHSGASSLLLVWDGGGGEEQELYGPGEGGEVLALPLPEGPGLLRRALEARALLEVDLARAGDADPAERALLGPVGRVVCLPLHAAGNSRGALVLGFPADSPAPDLTFLSAASGQAAIALENASLYQQAVRDPVTGFLSDAGFRQRLNQEIERARERRDAGVALVQLRVSGLPADDERATARLRECARRLRASVRGLPIFGRSGSADLKVALPWSGRPIDARAEERRLVERLNAVPWPDGEPVRGLLSSHAAWPADGPSARRVTSLLEERLSEAAAYPAAAGGFPAAELPPDFVAESPTIRQVLETVARLAQQELTILIAGETGTGKDRIAELVHRWSPRRAGPLVHIHCPSLTGNLIEDELFGHEVGAYTGAHSRRVGPFEYAAGGTVVLDEVGGISSEGQVALLRLLETREVLPLGASSPVRLDVRIVATTSADLALEVEQGRFRSDLYFRLNVAQISLPPLRLRRQDLPGLVDVAVRRFNAAAQRPVTGVDPKLLDLLLDHAWPGNVRELENVLARGLTLAAGGELGPEHVEGALLDVAEEGHPEPVEGLNERQERLVDALQEGERISSPEHAERAGVSSRTALRDLLELVEQGYLVREGRKRGTRFQRTRKGLTSRRGQ